MSESQNIDLSSLHINPIQVNYSASVAPSSSSSRTGGGKRVKGKTIERSTQPINILDSSGHIKLSQLRSGEGGQNSNSKQSLQQQSKLDELISHVKAAAAAAAGYQTSNAIVSTSTSAAGGSHCGNQGSQSVEAKQNSSQPGQIFNNNTSSISLKRKPSTQASKKHLLVPVPTVATATIEVAKKSLIIKQQVLNHQQALQKQKAAIGAREGSATQKAHQTQQLENFGKAIEINSSGKRIANNLISQSQINDPSIQRQNLSSAPPQNQLQNIGDSNLYKNLTQKIIREQYQQQQVNFSSLPQTQSQNLQIQEQKSLNENNEHNLLANVGSSKFGMAITSGPGQKKASSSNAKMMLQSTQPLSQYSLQQIFAGIKGSINGSNDILNNTTTIQSSLSHDPVVILPQRKASKTRRGTGILNQTQVITSNTGGLTTTKNQNQKQFEFGNFAQSQNNKSQRQVHIPKKRHSQKSQVSSKKLMNLTGTLPKSILSPALYNLNAHQSKLRQRPQVNGLKIDNSSGGNDQEYNQDSQPTCERYGENPHSSRQPKSMSSPNSRGSYLPMNKDQIITANTMNSNANICSGNQAISGNNIQCQNLIIGSDIQKEGGQPTTVIMNAYHAQPYNVICNYGIMEYKGCYPFQSNQQVERNEFNSAPMNQNYIQNSTQELLQHQMVKNATANVRKNSIKNISKNQAEGLFQGALQLKKQNFSNTQKFIPRSQSIESESMVNEEQIRIQHQQEDDQAIIVKNYNSKAQRIIIQNPSQDECIIEPGQLDILDNENLSHQAKRQKSKKQSGGNHKKTSTLPMAAVLLLNEIWQSQQQQQQQVEAKKPLPNKTVGQTPRNGSQQPQKKAQQHPDVDFHRLTSQKKLASTQPINFGQVITQGSVYFEEEAPDDIEVIVGGDEDSHQQYEFNSQPLIVSGGYDGGHNMNKRKHQPVVVHDEGEAIQQELVPPPGTLASHLSYSAFDHEKQLRSKPSDLPSPTNKETNIRLKRRQRSRSNGSNNNDSRSRSLGRINQEELYRQIENLQYPITPAKALKLLLNHMTDYEKGEILDFKTVYFLGIGADKVKGSPLHPYNFGYDDKRGDYKVVLRDHIGYRFEVLEFLGKGSFGQALKCFDHKTKELVAVKLIRNKQRFQHQAGVELKILMHLKGNDPDDAYNIIRIKDYMIFRKHLVISFELFSINLYEFIKNNNFMGVSLSLIRRFAIQILQALKYLREQNVIHCDLKPENILLKSQDKSGIKVIDFGSSCFEEERIYTYIQSRFYRAPEIILGIPYTTAIDMWSFGCILIELFTGYPIFPGENEQEQLSLIMEVRGLPPGWVLDQSTRRKLFFDDQTDEPLLLTYDSRGKLRVPGAKSIMQAMQMYQSTQAPTKSFIDFIERCLDWDPHTRMTPYEALLHDWVIEGLPPKVLLHHKRMLGVYCETQPDTEESHRGGSLNRTQPVREEQIVLNTSSSKKLQLNQTTVVEHNFIPAMQKKIIVTAKKQVKPLNNDAVGEKEKSKTTNMAELLHEIKVKKRQHDQHGTQSNGPQGRETMKFENTYDISKLIKKKKNEEGLIADDSDIIMAAKRGNAYMENSYDEDEDDEEANGGGQPQPFDERAHQMSQRLQESGSNVTGGAGQAKKKKAKLPFSFLMHNYLKTNAGSQGLASRKQQQDQGAQPNIVKMTSDI